MRTSIVGGVHILSAQLASIVQAGDCIAVSSRSEVFAVQRQVSEYQGNEGNFDQFRIYRQNIPEPELDEYFSYKVRHECPEIRVGFVTIIGISAAAVLNIGSCKTVDIENRTMNIRQLLVGKRPV